MWPKRRLATYDIRLVSPTTSKKAILVTTEDRSAAGSNDDRKARSSARAYEGSSRGGGSNRIGKHGAGSCGHNGESGVDGGGNNDVCSYSKNYRNRACCRTALDLQGGDESHRNTTALDLQSAGDGDEGSGGSGNTQNSSLSPQTQRWKLPTSLGASGGPTRKEKATATAALEPGESARKSEGGNKHPGTRERMH